MTDEQCQCLLDCINNLTQAVKDAAEKITDGLEGIYFPTDMSGVEKRLERLIDVLEEMPEREEEY